MDKLPVVAHRERRRHQRLPQWLKKKLGPSAPIHDMKVRLRDRGLHTVCEEASCPNIGECWTAGTATLMILGDICTRHCGFCDVTAGKPLPVDPTEPHHVAEMTELLQLKHLVLTCVARDDLPDRGAHHFVECIEAVRARCSDTKIEILTTDFAMITEAIDEVIAAAPDVFNHNLETVERLTAQVRHNANYRQTLDFLAYIKSRNPQQVSKSGLMLGLGEQREEVIQALRDLRGVDCQIVTIGQYLRPAQRNLPVIEFIPPEQFAEYEQIAYDLGFDSVASGPFVRSSYHAEQMLKVEKSGKDYE